MILFPVIARELRVSARQQLTYSLRIVGVAAALLAGTLFSFDRGFGANLGSQMFAYLHFTLFWSIWIFVPLATADCLSRERREGTLGLLFLTRLGAADIVVAKGMAHGLRAMTLWLAVLPVMTIPFLLGGLSAMEVLLSTVINFSAICWALAAGLLASAWSRRWVRAVALAAIFAAGGLLLFSLSAGAVLVAAIRRSAGSGALYYFDFDVTTSLDYVALSGLGFLSNATIHWPEYIRLSLRSGIFWTLGIAAIGSVLALGFSVLLAGIRIRRVWHEGPASQRRVWLEQTFCTPVVWIDFLRRWMRRKLERNPIGWLEQRTWSGRLVIWGWLATIVSFYSALLTNNALRGTANGFRAFKEMQWIIAWFLAGSMAASAAGSFRRERETGVLELILVSPLRTAQVVGGRLRGLWGQFLPAAALLLGAWWYLADPVEPQEDFAEIWFFTLTFLTLPVTGLYFSVACRNYITALLLTLAFGALTPMALDRAGLIVGIPLGIGVARLFAANFWQIAFACFFAVKLLRLLESRTFPVERGAM